MQRSVWFQCRTDLSTSLRSPADLYASERRNSASLLIPLDHRTLLNGLRRLRNQRRHGATRHCNLNLGCQPKRFIPEAKSLQGWLRRALGRPERIRLPHYRRRPIWVWPMADRVVVAMACPRRGRRWFQEAYPGTLPGLVAPQAPGTTPYSQPSQYGPAPTTSLSPSGAPPAGVDPHPADVPPVLPPNGTSAAAPVQSSELRPSLRSVVRYPQTSESHSRPYSRHAARATAPTARAAAKFLRCYRSLPQPTSTTNRVGILIVA